MQNPGLVRSVPGPGRNIGKFSSLRKGSNFAGLEFLAKVGSTGFLPVECVRAHQISQLQKILHSTGTC